MDKWHSCTMLEIKLLLPSDLGFFLKRSPIKSFTLITLFTIFTLFTLFALCGRHGICQMFYTSKIPKIFNFSRKKRVNRDIFGKKIEKIGCFTRLFWTICHSICKFLLKYVQSHYSYLWKFKPEFGKFHRKGICATCDKFQVCCAVLPPSLLAFLFI